MPKLLFAVLLVLQAHFAASYIVPLDNESQKEFSGLLRWAWPWSDGDSGPLGTVTATSGVPFTGFLLAVTASAALVLAAMAVLGWWVPFRWWRTLAIGGAILSLMLMMFLLGFTKLLPIAVALFVLWSTVSKWMSTGWSTAAND